jgi:hypothetical protein
MIFGVSAIDRERIGGIEPVQACDARKTTLHARNANYATRLMPVSEPLQRRPVDYEQPDGSLIEDKASRTRLCRGLAASISVKVLIKLLIFKRSGSRCFQIE